MANDSPKRSGTALVSALALGLMMTGGTALATDPEADCEVEFDALDQAIDNAEFTGNNDEMDRTRLKAKVDAAEAKVALDKFSDAIDKLDDISDKVAQLVDARKPKIDTDDAAVIIDAVSDAIGCVGLLGDT